MDNSVFFLLFQKPSLDYSVCELGFTSWLALLATSQKRKPGRTKGSEVQVTEIVGDPQICRIQSQLSNCARQLDPWKSSEIRFLHCGSPCTPSHRPGRIWKCDMLTGREGREVWPEHSAVGKSLRSHWQESILESPEFQQNACLWTNIKRCQLVGMNEEQMMKTSMILDQT